MQPRNGISEMENHNSNIHSRQAFKYFDLYTSTYFIFVISGANESSFERICDNLICSTRSKFIMNIMFSE